MMPQMTLDGKSLREEIGLMDDFEINPDENLDEKVVLSSEGYMSLVKKADDVARKNPTYFAKFCEAMGIKYGNKISLLNTFLCYANLEKLFGFATENMVNSLVAYSINKKMKND